MYKFRLINKAIDVAVTEMLASKFEGCVLPNHPMYAEALSREEFERAHSPIVQAAYEIACEVHGNHPRNPKRDLAKPIAYITHPIMVCKFLGLLEKALRPMGVSKKHLTGDIYLSVALLHDVLEEEGTAYYHQPDKLMHDLCGRIVNRVVIAELKAKYGCEESVLDPAIIAHAVAEYSQDKKDSLKEICREIVGDCNALCNPEAEHMPDGKRFWQSDHISGLRSRPKLIKMLDQLASVTEDLLFESARDIQSITEFSFKALEVVKAGAAMGESEHKLTEEIFLQMFNRFAGIRKLHAKTVTESDARGQYHQKFAENREDLLFCPTSKNTKGGENIIQQALDSRVHSMGAIRSLWLKSANEFADVPNPATQFEMVAHPAFAPVKPEHSVNDARYNGILKLPQYGCVRVSLVHDHGRVYVAGYSMAKPDYLLNRAPSSTAEITLMLARKASNYIMGTLELSHDGSYVKQSGRESHEGEMVHDYLLHKPLELKKFLEALNHAGQLLRKDVHRMIQSSSNHETTLSKEQLEILSAIDDNTVANPLFSVAMRMEIARAEAAMLSGAAHTIA